MFRSQTIRFPTPIHQRLKDLADDSGRSFNKQVVQMLRAALEGDEQVCEACGAEWGSVPDRPNTRLIIHAEDCPQIKEQ